MIMQASEMILARDTLNIRVALDSKYWILNVGHPNVREDVTQ